MPGKLVSDNYLFSDRILKIDERSNLVRLRMQLFKSPWRELRNSKMVHAASSSASMQSCKSLFTYTYTQIITTTIIMYCVNGQGRKHRLWVLENLSFLHTGRWFTAVLNHFAINDFAIK